MTEVRPIDLSPKGIEQTCELLNVVYPHAAHYDTTYLERLFNQNPVGPTLGFSAFDGDELVAHYLMLPIRARVFGEEEIGIWPFQLATRPGFRGKGLFSELNERCFEASRERGYGYLAGVGNQNSTPIFVGKWGFQMICALDVKLGLGPLPPSRKQDDLELVRIWDEASIAWRLNHPAQPYAIETRNGRGHLYAPTERYGVQVEVGSFDLALLPEDLPRYAPPHPLRLWIGVDPSRDWSRSLYFNIPVRFRPSPLYLLFYDLTDKQRHFQPERVKYDIFDFDAY